MKGKRIVSEDEYWQIVQEHEEAKGQIEKLQKEQRERKQILGLLNDGRTVDEAKAFIKRHHTESIKAHPLGYVPSFEVWYSALKE